MKCTGGNDLEQKHISQYRFRISGRFDDYFTRKYSYILERSWDDRWVIYNGNSYVWHGSEWCDPTEVTDYRYCICDTWHELYKALCCDTLKECDKQIRTALTVILNTVWGIARERGCRNSEEIMGAPPRADT